MEIMEVTIVGKIPELASGSVKVRPSEMELREFMIASSTMRLPEVLATFSRLSRIGVPAATMVPKVRAKRATADFRRIIPNTGRCSVSRST
ncbi:MAG: hypothetical protein HQL57_10660 [Magnetococcales bacterium]|nr:hypothetical protein [Magnetococcales bacterium]